MFELITTNPAHGEPRMTSLQIAELVEKRHDNVKRTIETLAEQGVITLPQIEEVSNPGAGPKKIGAYIFDIAKKRDSLIVVAQLCPEFTARLVDRWQELEERAASGFALPKSLPEALRLAAEIEEKRLQLEHRVVELEPKAAALERISAGEKSLTMTQAAKVLGIKRDALTKMLQVQSWIYRQNGSWVAYSTAIKAGRLEYKEAHFTHENTGLEEARPYCHITQKGMTEIAQILDMH